MSFVECKSSNRVFYDIFESSNRVLAILKLTAGAEYERKIPKENSRRSSEYSQLSSQFSLNFVEEDFLNRVFLQI